MTQHYYQMHDQILLTPLVNNNQRLHLNWAIMKYI